MVLVFNFGWRRLEWMRVFPGAAGPVQRIGRGDAIKARRRHAPPEYIPASKRARHE
ncbi:MAG: hypothetical protein J7M34_10130 [Anaerolineae bacterium]|nr:hypothetical protein [Anaerolineae bacterium]